MATVSSILLLLLSLTVAVNNVMSREHGEEVDLASPSDDHREDSSDPGEPGDSREDERTGKDDFKAESEFPNGTEGPDREEKSSKGDLEEESVLRESSGPHNEDGDLGQRGNSLEGTLKEKSDPQERQCPEEKNSSSQDIPEAKSSDKCDFKSLNMSDLQDKYKDVTKNCSFTFVPGLDPALYDQFVKLITLCFNNFELDFKCPDTRPPNIYSGIPLLGNVQSLTVRSTSFGTGYSGEVNEDMLREALDVSFPLHKSDLDEKLLFSCSSFAWTSEVEFSNTKRSESPADNIRKLFCVFW